MSRLEYRDDLAREQVSDWQFDGACAEVDPEAWFPDRGSFAAPLVFAVCAGCPVRRSCLAAALHGREQGVWAGTTAEDRDGLLRLLRLGLSAATVLNLGLAAAEHKQHRGAENPSESREAVAA